MCGWCGCQTVVWYWPTESFEYQNTLGLTPLPPPVSVPSGWYGCDLCARLYRQGISEALVRHLLETRLDQDPALLKHGLNLEREVDQWARAIDDQLAGLAMRRASH
jgi:hypothetical protein